MNPFRILARLGDALGQIVGPVLVVLLTHTEPDHQAPRCVLHLGDDNQPLDYDTCHWEAVERLVWERAELVDEDFAEWDREIKESSQ